MSGPTVSAVSKTSDITRGQGKGSLWGGGGGGGEGEGGGIVLSVQILRSDLESKTSMYARLA